jgi:hypothetical protein
MRLFGTDEGGGMSEYCLTPFSLSQTYCAHAAVAKVNAASAAAALEIRFNHIDFIAILVSFAHIADFATLHHRCQLNCGFRLTQHPQKQRVLWISV